MKSARERNKEMTIVEHMRLRMGMYVPTEAGRPKPWVWENLLYALAADGVESFLLGEATHLAIDGYGKRIAVAHDGRLGTGGVERVFKLQDGNPVLAGVHWCWFGNIRYALASALAERLVIEASEGGEWRAVESRCGVAGPVQRLLPGLVGEEKGVRIAFVPDRAFLPEGVEAIEAWEPEELRRFGAALACGQPGLWVSVNGREFFMPEGPGGLVERQMEEVGGEVLAPVAVAEIPGMSFAWGAVRRREPGRRLAGRVFVNGRETKWKALLGPLGEMVLGWLCDSRCLPGGACTVFFALFAELPDKFFADSDYARRLWDRDSGDWCASSGDMVLPPLFSLAAQCLAQAFGRRLA